MFWKETLYGVERCQTDMMLLDHIGFNVFPLKYCKRLAAFNHSTSQIYWRPWKQMGCNNLSMNKSASSLMHGLPKKVIIILPRSRWTILLNRLLIALWLSHTQVSLKLNPLLQHHHQCDQMFILRQLRILFWKAQASPPKKAPNNYGKAPPSQLPLPSDSTGRGTSPTSFSPRAASEPNKMDFGRFEIVL